MTKELSIGDDQRLEFLGKSLENETKGMVSNEFDGISEGAGEVIHSDEGISVISNGFTGA